MTTSPAEPPESTLADPGVCWRGECRSGCYYTDGCSLGNTTRLTPTAARIAHLEADLAAAEAKLAAVEVATQWGIEWYEKAAGFPDVSGPFDSRAEAEIRLSTSVFGGRIVRRVVTTTKWTPPALATQPAP